MSNRLELTNILTTNFDDLGFGQAQQTQMTIGKTFRIPIQVKYSTGNRYGPLIISTMDLFSFGISPNYNDNNEINGYSIPLCMWDTKRSESDTVEERQWVAKYDELVEKIKQYLLQDEVKEEIERYDLDEAELKKFGTLWYKRGDKNKILTDVAPRLYPKLIIRKKDNEILSKFFDRDTGEELKPMSIVGQRCNITAALRVESVFVGSKISLQVKIHEAHVELIQSNQFTSRLLHFEHTEPEPEAEAE